MKHHVIYVPGIMDDVAYVQSTLVRLWRRHDVIGHTHSMPWVGAADYPAKARRLIALIDRLHAQGHTVSLVGASAGASAVLNAYYERLDVINGVVLICPKINNSNNVGLKITAKNPSFIQSLKVLEVRLPQLTDGAKQRLILLLSPRDGLITREDSLITGVHEQMLPSLRHNAAILYCLSFGSKKVVDQLNLFTVKP